jgi:bifunctional enzyme CysN/CysC
VDDGKSTLIGRLLYDSKQILQDQLEHVEAASRQRGAGYVDLALLMDGLRAEREQGITIDVAYRYFTTARRRFIIADTPGHEQYTRNMVTGASTANLALMLIDARKGVLEQSRRHAFIASLLRIPHVVVCVNKMDLVDWSQDVFDAIVDDFTDFSARLDLSDVTFVPISALHGENVVEPATHMPWYDGPPLLYHLEHVHIASDRNLVDARFPVQWVIRPRNESHHDYRGYSGQMASGILRAGDEIVVLPTGRASRIKSIETFDGPLDEAFPPLSVTLRLEDQVDVSRGDVICRPANQPTIASGVEATVCWMSEAPLRPGGRYALKHLTRTVTAKVTELRYRIDVNTLHRDTTSRTLGLNEIGRIRVQTSAPIAFDPFARNRATGSFILIDESTNDTLAAGMIVSAVTQPAVDVHSTTASPRRSPNVVWHAGGITRSDRWARLGQRGATVWLTGLPASGKTTVAAALEAVLVSAGRSAYLLDGDNLRHGLTGDLGFTPEDRAENVRRTAEAARLLADSGVVVLVSLVSPYTADRMRARAIHESAGLEFLEVWVSTPREECEQRDPKGLYRRARAGELRGLTGVDAPYEPPSAPDLELNGAVLSVDAAVEELLALLRANGVID